MFIGKSCPRCKGDVWVDRDEYGWYKQCIMCGYMRDLKDIRVTKPHHSRDHNKSPKRTVPV